MDRFKIDYDALINNVLPNPNKMPLVGNEHRLIRVAFDVFRLKDGDPDDLWQVQSSDDGEFLVRTFSIPDEEKIVESSDWSVQVDKKEENLTIAYKQMPLIRIATKDYGVKTSNEAHLLRRVVYNKLNKDEQFVQKLIASLPIEKQNIFQNIIKTPEPETNEWSLAFLDLEMRKNAKCGKDHEQKASETQEFEIFDEKAKELMDLINEVETGEKDYEKFEDFVENMNDDFEAAWWDSGMETYGPGASGFWGAEADKAEEVREKVNDFLTYVANDPHLSKTITIGELEDLIQEVKKFDAGGGYEDLEEALEKTKNKVEKSSQADDQPTYQEYFMEKAKEFGIDATNLPEVPEERLKEFFEAVDKGWIAKNEHGPA